MFWVRNANGNLAALDAGPAPAMPRNPGQVALHPWPPFPYGFKGLGWTRCPSSWSGALGRSVLGLLPRPGVFSLECADNLASASDVEVASSLFRVAAVGRMCSDERRNEWASLGVRENSTDTFSCAPSSREGVITGVAILGSHPSWKPRPHVLVSPPHEEEKWSNRLPCSRAYEFTKHFVELDSRPLTHGGAGIQGHRVGKG